MNNNTETEIEKIYQAIIYNDLSLIKKLVEEDGINIHHNDDRAFLMSCYWGNVEVIDYFLSKGADINASSTPVYCGHDKYSLHGNALSLVADNSQWGAFDFLLEKGIKVNLNNSLALEKVLYKRDFDRAKILISKGADINDTDSFISAISQSQWQIAKFILNETNVDIHVNNNLALRHSCYLNKNEMVEALVEKGANINDTSTENFDEDDYESVGREDCALTYTIYNNNGYLFHYLIMNGANLNINNQEPFLYACSLIKQHPKYKKFVEYYIEKESVVFNEDVFEAIVKTTDLELLKYFLLDYPNKDIDEKCLLQNKVIYEEDNIDIFEYLLNNGYEITQLTRNLLAEEKKDEFLKILSKHDLKHDLDNELVIQTGIGKKIKI